MGHHTEEHSITPLPMRLVGTAVFWQSVIRERMDLALLPRLYRYHQDFIRKGKYPRDIIATDGTLRIYATVSTTQVTLTRADYLPEPCGKESALQRGYEWHRTTLRLHLDKAHHFLRMYQQRRFELALLSTGYLRAKGLKNCSTLAINDGDSRILIKKVSPYTLVLCTGMRRESPLWQSFDIHN